MNALFFAFNGALGRLSRVLWTKPLSFPMSLRHLRVVIAETGPHHSWTTDHLNSISAVPLHALSSLSIERREALPSLNNGSPTYEVVVDDVVAIKPVPREFIEKMKQTKSNLTALQCDFWGYSISDVKVLLESCPKLEVCLPRASPFRFPEQLLDSETLPGCPFCKTFRLDIYFCVAFELAYIICFR